MAGDSIGYVVVNTGRVPIMLGEAYELERRADGEWERLRLPYVFRLWGRRVEAGGRCELSARVPPDVQAGRYRLRKQLAADREPDPGYEWVAGREVDPIYVTAEFDVTSG